MQRRKALVHQLQYKTLEISIVNVHLQVGMCRCILVQSYQIQNMLPHSDKAETHMR